MDCICVIDVINKSMSHDSLLAIFPDGDLCGVCI